METDSSCGCSVIPLGDSRLRGEKLVGIEYCAIHDAAPTMLDYLREFCKKYQGNKMATLGNGHARKALLSFRDIVKDLE